MWRSGGKIILAALIAALPVIVVWFLASSAVGPSLPPAFNPKAEHYPAAIEGLQATSQTLVTITLATVGGAGLLILRGRSLLAGASALAVFVCSVISLYRATELGRSAALTLAADAGDIKNLVPLLDNQAVAALIAGIALALMACLVAARRQDGERHG